jgi:formiminoglutamase
MTKPSISQSQKRLEESVGALFLKSDETSGNICLFLKSSTDVGVIRNGGRNGARFAPQSFIASFKKFARHQGIEKFRFVEVEVGNQLEEQTDFHLAQKQEAQRIRTIYLKHAGAHLCHLGGGHDHIYPLLTALAPSYAKIVVINIDAHADTRTDENFHSGTPFRQFAQDYGGKFSLYQIGLHAFANATSTLCPLPQGTTEVLWRKDISNKLVAQFQRIRQEVDSKTLVIFSLDADALTAAEVPAVSAVNPAGITTGELRQVWHLYQELPLGHAPVVGIYELNPLYDSLASLSMRTLGSFLYECLGDER